MFKVFLLRNRDGPGATGGRTAWLQGRSQIAPVGHLSPKEGRLSQKGWAAGVLLYFLMQKAKTLSYDYYELAFCPSRPGAGCQRFGAFRMIV